jgi:eukaryotic-like serine/threonine-protein kinase
MMAPAETQSTKTMSLPGPGGFLRFAKERFAPSSTRWSERLENDVAQEGAHRLGTLAILTAVTVLGIAVLEGLLQPELASHRTPLFRGSALLLVLSSAGLAALQWWSICSPQLLLDLGLVFEVIGALALGLIESSIHWSNATLGRSTAVAGWIAICAMVIPNRPWKSVTAAFLSAAMLPCAHLLAARILGYPPAPWNQVAGHSLVAFFVAAWTPFISTRLHQMQRELSRTQDLGSYKLEALLGRGGMGEVWRASHTLLRRNAAIKLVRRGLLTEVDSPEWRQIHQRFELEAQAMASLRSPHTAALYDFGRSDDGSLYYVMELLDGLDAETLVAQFGPQPAARVISILRQACESLEEAHAAGMVHRDVKPGNLFLCRVGKRTDFVKLLDFGLVKALYNSGQSQLTEPTDSLGTPAFMSPEQVRGSEDIDARADIYGLGCVAYYLLTGTLVFHYSSAISTALAHIEHKPEPPSKRAELPIPPSLERVVMSCLEKERADRPQTAAELDALLAACADVPEWSQADARRWWLLHRPERNGATA